MLVSPVFKSLLEGINAQIKTLNNNDLKIYDEENPEYFITRIKYDEQHDKLIFESKEDPKEFKRITDALERE